MKIDKELDGTEYWEDLDSNIYKNLVDNKGNIINQGQRKQAFSKIVLQSFISISKNINLDIYLIPSIIIISIYVIFKH